MKSRHSQELLGRNVLGLLSELSHRMFLSKLLIYVRGIFWMNIVDCCTETILECKTKYLVVRLIENLFCFLNLSLRRNQELSSDKRLYLCMYDFLGKFKHLLTNLSFDVIQTVFFAFTCKFGMVI